MALTAEQKRFINEYMPTLGNRPPGIDLGAILDVLDDAADKLAVAALTGTDATGGGTTANLALTLTGLDGEARSGVIVLFGNTTQYAPALASNLSANPTFSAPVDATIVDSAAGYCVLQVTGPAPSVTVTNAVDETLYFSAATAQGGVSVAGDGIVVYESNSLALTWSA